MTSKQVVRLKYRRSEETQILIENKKILYRLLLFSYGFVTRYMLDLSLTLNERDILISDNQKKLDVPFHCLYVHQMFYRMKYLFSSFAYHD